MDVKQAKRLRVNSKVFWDEDTRDTGNVAKIGVSGFFVEWENGQSGWIDFEDAQKITKEKQNSRRISDHHYRS